MDNRGRRRKGRMRVRLKDRTLACWRMVNRFCYKVQYGEKRAKNLCGARGLLTATNGLGLTQACEERSDLSREPEIEFFVEQLRVVERLVDEENADRCKDIGRHPHALEWREDGLAGEFFPEVVQQEKDNEEDHGKDQGHADAALANDGAEGCADDEHDHAGDRQGYLFVPGHLVLQEVLLPCIEQGHGLAEGDLALVDDADGFLCDVHTDAVRQQVVEGGLRGILWNGVGGHGRDPGVSGVYVAWLADDGGALGVRPDGGWSLSLTGVCRWGDCGWVAGTGF